MLSCGSSSSLATFSPLDEGLQSLRTSVICREVLYISVNDVDPSPFRPNRFFLEGCQDRKIVALFSVCEWKFFQFQTTTGKKSLSRKQNGFDWEISNNSQHRSGMDRLVGKGIVFGRSTCDYVPCDRWMKRAGMLFLSFSLSIRLSSDGLALLTQLCALRELRSALRLNPTRYSIYSSSLWDGFGKLTFLPVTVMFTVFTLSVAGVCGSGITFTFTWTF